MASHPLFFFFLFFYLWWILSYIEMKQPWVYMCSPSWSPLPPPSPPAPSRSSQCTRSERLSHASPLAFNFSQFTHLFPLSQLFASGGQSIGASASASVLPMNIQDWFPLGWTGLISLLSKGLSRVSSTVVQKCQFFQAQPSLWSNSHIHAWLLENHSFVYRNLCIFVFISY